MQKKKEYAVLTAVCTLFLIMLPKVCAQSGEKPMTSDEAAKARARLIEYSKGFLGCPYRSGSTGPATFDCSGFVFSMFRESTGIQLPRKSSAIYSKSTKIEDSEREPGDLVFFKTTSSGAISHVGIYIGDSKFIHSASDGRETGVIISTLERGYWKTHYTASGRYIPSAQPVAGEKIEESPEEKAWGTDGENSELTDSAKSPSKSVSLNSGNSEKSKKSDTFVSKIALDATAAIDWNFFDSKSFALKFRGGSATFHAAYGSGEVKPGLGATFRYDTGTGVFQIPLIATLSLGEFLRIFMGPVVTIGEASLPGDSDREIEASFFPGIIGMAWSSPSLKIGKTALSFVQDIHYTIFNDTDKSAQSPKNSVVSGLVFSSGIRVTLPLSNVL